MGHPARHPLAALALTLLVAAAPAAAERVGFLAVSQGDVRVRPSGGAWQLGRQDETLSLGDAVRTGFDSRAKILLDDDTLLHLDEETEIVLEAIHVGAAARRETSIVRQSQGRLRTIVGSAFGGATKLEVHLPTAAVGVKGTDFETRDDPLPDAARWRACLHTGGIEVRNGFGSASPRPGHCVYAYEDRAPGDEFPNPDAPLAVRNGATRQELAAGDFMEPPDVAAGGKPPGGPDDPDGRGYPGYDDELENELLRPVQGEEPDPNSDSIP